MGADGVPPVPLVEHLAQPVGLAQPSVGAQDVADRNGAPEDRGGVMVHRVVGEGDEVVVPSEYLRPVRLLCAQRVVVQGGDGGLDLVTTGALFLCLRGQRRLKDEHAFGDLVGVPKSAVLSVQRDDAPLRVESRREAGVVEKHQGEQPTRLRLLCYQSELTGQPDRLASQVDPARMARRVDEIEHAQHDGEVAGLVQAAPRNGALCSADPLCHRRLRQVEGVGDLPGGEAADGAQGECHLRGGREVGVTAAEEQEEGVVALLGGGGQRLAVHHLLTAVTGGLAAAGVDEPSGRDGREPSVRVARRVLGPHPQRLQQRLLERVLSRVEVLAPPDHAPEYPRDEDAQRGLVQLARWLIDHSWSVA